ncbi:hypothetical protein AVEN_150468-1 [Araneus ventricosus]|uniref:Uncharacterized protein n=1 Tax=Araneus ventricosus TaxID=182803 RepID=A0A4Y2GRG9_ARAVE|nr:hypothetical protein AVEN_150468-1 [Araneus ventricosus]
MALDITGPLPVMTKDTQVVLEHPEVDDAEDDPEYKVLDEEDVPDYNDLRYDSSVKITRDELNALMAEILDFAQQDLGDLDDEEDEENRTQVGNDAPPVVNVGPASIENVQSQWMSSDERLQLDEQMRMYVQILTQSYLLSHGNPQLNFLNVSSKLFLDEIKMFASREMASNERSAFYAQNLDGALEIVNEYENRKIPSRPRSLPQMKKSVLPCLGGHCIRPPLPVQRLENFSSKTFHTSKLQCGGAPLCWKMILGYKSSI